MCWLQNTISAIKDATGVLAYSYEAKCALYLRHIKRFPIFSEHLLNYVVVWTCEKIIIQKSADIHVSSRLAWRVAWKKFD